jgi:uncharacterized protein
MKKRILLFVNLCLSIVCFAQQNSSQPAKDSMPLYQKTPTGYLMVLREGADVLQSLEQLAIAENIPSAGFTGMGFVHAEFGFFNFDTKEYDPKSFRNVELASLTGSIAWQNGKPSLHTHGVITGKDFAAFGGHVLKLSVSTGSVELHITRYDKRLTRKEETPPGANVLQLK